MRHQGWATYEKGRGRPLGARDASLLENKTIEKKSRSFKTHQKGKSRKSPPQKRRRVLGEAY